MVVTHHYHVLTGIFITIVSGKEFSHRKIIADALDSDIYFANLYCHAKEGLTNIQMG